MEPVVLCALCCQTECRSEPSRHGHIVSKNRLERCFVFIYSIDFFSVSSITAQISTEKKYDPKQKRNDPIIMQFRAITFHQFLATDK